ncbi:MAG: ComF family protein [Deltaproteobacteria bacterium]
MDIVYPRTCLVCKNNLKGQASIDDFVCNGCWSKIKKNPPPFCHCCGRHLDTKNPVKNICLNCLKTKFHFDRAFSPCLYEGVAKELIHQFKYKNKDYLGPTLARLMTEFIKEYDLPMDCIDVIVPVPLHKTRLREREFNQAQVLGSAVAREFVKDIRSSALVRLRHTRTQTELDEEKRFQNVRDGFAVAGAQNLKGSNILLVDDVLTTGATSSEAACALKKAGANIVFVLTLAN